MEDLSTSILVQNDKAIRLIRQSSYREAMVSLKGALRQIMHSVDDDLETKCSLTPMANEITVQSVALCGDNPSEKVACGVHAGTFVMFARALVPIGSEQDIFASSYNQERTSAALLYNMALIHHLMGIKGHLQDNNYRKALRLYDMALNVLTSEALPYSSSDCLLRMSVYNNKGHIHASFFETQEAQGCIECMVAVLRNCSSDSSVVFDEDIFHFHLNVLLARGKRDHAPAA